MYLTEGDRQILPMALRQNGGFHLACQWYLDFDPLPYQYAAHQVLTPNLTLLAGIAAGKTRLMTASCAIDCISIPYFKVLNTSVTAKQAQLAFDMFMGWYETCPRLAHHVDDISLRPWPKVLFKNYSEYEFRTSGKDARFIRGTEYDRIVCDEFGLDYNGESVKILRGRLRGIRPNRVPRMGRMDVITSPTDALWLIERFERGWPGSGKEELDMYRSMRVTTYDNTKLPPGQIALMEAEYTDELIEVELKAEFPDYGMSMFPKRHIVACTDQGMNDQAYLALNPEDDAPPKKGYVWEESPRHGITKFEWPFDPQAEYVLAGDPGTDDPPHNNAGAVIVFNVSAHPHKLAYFDWTYGHGSYMPFLNSFKYAIEKYRPTIKAIDSTGTQKGIRELAFEQTGIETDKINFSTDKNAALNALSLAISNQELRFPLIKGLDRQLSSYTLENDKKSDFPKDLTMTLAMIAHAARYVPRTGVENNPRPAVYPRISRSGRLGRRR